MTKIPFIYNLRSMKIRWLSTIIAVLGIAGVVTVFVAMLSLATGFRETVKASGSEENAMVRRAGALSEMQSVITLEQAKIIGDADGVARDSNSNPLISSEVVVIAPLPMRSTGDETNALIRGVSSNVFKVRDKVKLTKGRLFTPGLLELVIGKNAVMLYKNTEPGNKLVFGGQTWTVVGSFDGSNSSFDSEIWCDANLLNQTFKRPTEICQALTAKLKSIDSFNTFKDKLTSDPRLTVDVERESDYYKRQSKPLTKLIEVLGFLVAFVMAIGAVFAALNTMYAAVSERSPEVATLRALGFNRSSVVASFLLESLFVSLMGGIAGCLISLPLNGFTASTSSFTTFSYMAFAFRVTPALLLQGIIFALLMGFFGGLFPALRAARQPIAGTLRGM